jgi:hypothetical protein
MNRFSKIFLKSKKQNLDLMKYSFLIGSSLYKCLVISIQNVSKKSGTVKISCQLHNAIFLIKTTIKKGLHKHLISQICLLNDSNLLKKLEIGK